MAGGQRVHIPAGEVGAELQEVGAVGLERVAREAALELEVGQEVEQLMLEAPRLGADHRHGSGFARAAARPLACKGACAVRAPGRRACGAGPGGPPG